MSAPRVPKRREKPLLLPKLSVVKRTFTLCDWVRRGEGGGVWPQNGPMVSEGVSIWKKKQKKVKCGSVIELHFLICVLELKTGQFHHLLHDLQMHFSPFFSLLKEELWKIHTVPNKGSLKNKKMQAIRGNSCRELGGLRMFNKMHGNLWGKTPTSPLCVMRC